MSVPTAIKWRTGWGIITILTALAAPAWAQEPLKVVGSTTVAGALDGRQSELEAKVGREIEFIGTSSTLGLEALAKGDADMGMISNPLEEIAAGLNAKNAGLVDPKAYRVALVGHAKLRFVVNPRNPIRQVTTAQLGDLLAGKIKSWAEVGGLDAPVLVVAIGRPGAELRDTVMHGANFPATTRIVISADQIASVVSSIPNAIGVITAAHKRGQTSILQTDVDIELPLFLVTKGEPDPVQAKLIAAAQAALLNGT
jgi:phosphate transport system substrate-binding protein